MAHIPDGILSAPVLIGGAVCAAGGIFYALRGLDDRLIPRTAVLSAGLFALSLIAVPVGPSSIHLLLGGVMGIMLGPATFLAVAVALLLQCLLFGFGGLTTLGVNVVNIALPAVVCGALLGPVVRTAAHPAARFAAGLLAGALPVLGTAGLVALSLWLSGSAYAPAARVLAVTYLPLAGVEACVTAALVTFLARVQPDALRPVAP